MNDRRVNDSEGSRQVVGGCLFLSPFSLFFGALTYNITFGVKGSKSEKMMEEITKELSLHLTAFIIGLV